MADLPINPFDSYMDARACPRGEQTRPNDLLRCGTCFAIRRHRAKAE